MLVIGNGRMITRDASNAFIENGAVAVDGNTIKMVGVTDEVKKTYPDAEFVDAHGGIIMPAFINAHEHIYSAFERIKCQWICSEGISGYPGWNVVEY